MSSSNTMKAAQFDENTKEVKINDIPIPQVTDDNQILVKIASASLCHSDLMLLDGAFPGPGRPVALGHEGVGYVQKTGKNVKGFKEGDRIGFLYVTGCCFECEGCQIHNLNCENGQARLHGFSEDGFFAEYALVDYHNAITLPDSLDMKSSDPIFCAGITAYHAVNECELQPGQWLAVIGCGGLGLLAIQYAKAMDLRVVGIDVNDEVLASAKAAGAEHTYNSMRDKDYVEELKKATRGGAHAAAVFSAAKPAYDGALNVLRMNGLIMAIGLMSRPLEINSIAFMRGLFRIKSTATGPPHKMPPALKFTADHGIKTNVAYYKLEDIHEMIDLMKSGKSKGRMAVLFGDEAKSNF
ncbi:chaperonin 10-like protein [Cryomyces antarcticus]|uniref:Enoyl reductase (ER) domain-containing protein n=1 Tax=Cryomyces antarcticus TaxID=329879 RepID=A0ABR0LSY0_9PEZI|nr:hypothetical protein LTR39_000326 [Cryomyces antarcticus]KAK5020890.1 hypothetical protein LTR60_000196 [Cryomyces antarcticus]KAK5202073.1 hypothetical protein LTR16_000464 [Cryomyces antarcticus]